VKRLNIRLLQRHSFGSLEKLAAMLNRSIKRPRFGADAMLWELAGDDGVIRFQMPASPGLAARKNACQQIGRILAEYTLTEQEPLMLREYCHCQFGVKDPVELDALVAEAVALLDGSPEQDTAGRSKGRERRLRKLAARFAAGLAEHERFHVDGYIRFRLKDYLAEVAEAAETAWEEKRQERQYQDFMELLKSLAQWQETGVPVVHVLHGGGQAFRLLDENMRPLPGGIGQDGEETGEENELVSRLLSVSPEQVHIHTPEPDSQVIRTLVFIFGERAALYPHNPQTPRP
jgi:putative sporulation protein YtxC